MVVNLLFITCKELISIIFEKPCESLKAMNAKSLFYQDVI